MELSKKQKSEERDETSKTNEKEEVRLGETLLV